jgi:hypothetical protein
MLKKTRFTKYPHQLIGSISISAFPYAIYTTPSTKIESRICKKQFFTLQTLQTVSAVMAAPPEVHEHAWNYKGLAARAGSTLYRRSRMVPVDLIQQICQSDDLRRVS